MTVNNRFYPDSILPFPNEALRSNFDIIHSAEFGDGIISLTSFEPGNIVFSFTGDILQHTTLYTLQITPGKYIQDPFVMGKVLHSCDPNLLCDMQSFSFFALKNIRPGDYLTMDYESTEDVLSRPFQCCCGTAKCRGVIKGKKLQ
jgi:tyrocidine synthetase-3